jgi:tRNA-2-methylthio-N6-dimethylallyladenosine synthase
VQSGSSAILQAMNREYTRDWYLERMSWIKAAKRDISITSDIIIGFPGETDADFEQTVTLLAEVKYDAVFAFKYSPRPNTPAITLADSIPEEVKTERLRILNDRQRELQRELYARHLNQVVEVMVEGFHPQRNQIVGRSTQNKTVNFTSTQPEPPTVGSYVDVRITQTMPNSLLGEALPYTVTPPPSAEAAAAKSLGLNRDLLMLSEAR